MKIEDNIKEIRKIIHTEKMSGLYFLILSGWLIFFLILLAIKNIFKKIK